MSHGGSYFFGFMLSREMIRVVSGIKTYGADPKTHAKTQESMEAQCFGDVNAEISFTKSLNKPTKLELQTKQRPQPLHPSNHIFM